MRELTLFRRYMEAVRQGLVEVPTCDRCESVLLYYPDTDNEVYWRCTGCNRISVPGSRAIREMQDIVDRMENG